MLDSANVASNAPVLSLILPVKACSRQAEHALLTLCSDYQEQQGARVEVLVIEAESSDMLGESRARALGTQIRYFEIAGGAASRSRSFAAGLRESTAPFVGFFRDGSHWVTPRFLSIALKALRVDDRPLVVLPEYRLDPSKVDAVGDADAELAWLESSNYGKRPYDVFSNFRWGPSNPNGFLGPIFGGQCLLAPRAAFEALPPFDPAKDVPGGTAYALWQYMELARVPLTRLVALAGEGAVRIHHPELDSAEVRSDETSQAALLFNAVAPLGPGFRTLHRQPLAFGPVPGPLQRFLAESVELAEFHCAMCRNRGDAEWFEDAVPG